MFPLEQVPDIDLGDDHYLTFSRWRPDDLPQNRNLYGIPDGQPMPSVEKWGATIRHYKPDGTMCEGCITFDGEWQRKSHENDVAYRKKHGKEPLPYVAWTIESLEPLTLSPSLLCHCGDHGFIRGGKWARA